MAKNAMPVSRARTAYGLLSEIRKLILEEPKRYDQTAWRYKWPVGCQEAPACGTTACVAGWVVTLKVPDFSAYQHSFEDEGARVLGLSPAAAEALFDGNAAKERGDGRRDILRHAKRGAAHIARFQKKYAKQLRSKRV